MKALHDENRSYYHFCLLLFIAHGWGNILLTTESKDILMMQSAVMGSVAIALTSAAIAYRMKLYKLYFQYSSEQENDDQLFLKRPGTIVYFLMRPIFSVVLVVVSIRSALLNSSLFKNKLEVGFIYLCMMISFYMGFLSGEFIKKLVSKFREII
jgi:hypothetical protein